MQFRQFSRSEIKEMLKHKKAAERLLQMDCYQVKIGKSVYPIPKVLVDSEIKSLYMPMEERISKGCSDYYSEPTILHFIENGDDLEEILKDAKNTLAQSNALNSYGGDDGYGPFQTMQISQFISALKNIIKMSNPLEAINMIERINSKSSDFRFPNYCN